MPTPWTAETLWPAQGEQIVAASLLARKARLEFELVARVILHQALHYILGSPESSGYQAHPFVDGNGRTTRAVSYYVLCSKLNFYFPGVTTIPEFIARGKQPYYKALEAADEAQEAGKIDVAAMEGLLKNLLARQMVLALEGAESPSPEPRPKRSGADQAARSQTGSSLPSGKTGGQQFSLRTAAAFGALALVFFMLLSVLAVMGYEVPQTQRFLLVIVLALSGGLSAAFVGGNASARGSIPIHGAQQHPVRFAVSGGVATLILLLIVGTALF